MRFLKIFLIFTLLSFLNCYDDSLLDIYKNSITYNLRDQGPAGGYIIYINPEWQKDGWRYLEAGSNDIQSGGQTWSNIIAAIGVTCRYTSIGSGLSNSNAIIGQSGHTDSAALLCKNHRGGGYDDWHLPSKDELKLMYTILYASGISNFSGQFYYYWSSTEIDNNNSWVLYFYDGIHYSHDKNIGLNLCVRPVRRF